MNPLYCKWCGETTHVAGMDCPRAKTKRGSKDNSSSPGDWVWFVPPEYSPWHSTIEARTADVKIVGLDGAR